MPESDDFASELRGDMKAVSGGDGKPWLQGVIAVLQALVIAGILALFGSISGLKESQSDTKAAITGLQVTLSEREKQNDRDIARIETQLRGHDQRITELERSEGAHQSNADYRQKRR